MATVDICPKCGSRQTRANARYCGQCGATLPEAVLIVCPQCGAPRRNPTAEFCGLCGTAYVIPPPPAPPVGVPESAPEPDLPPAPAAEPEAVAPPRPSQKSLRHHDVFISYSSKDKPVADAVCASLEQNGIRCWIAPRDVLPGEDFPKAIIHAIKESKILVLIFSASANASPHVVREVTKAVGKGIMIIPFRIEDAPMSESMEYLIGLPHWLDAITSPMEQHIDTLVRRLTVLLEGP